MSYVESSKRLTLAGARKMLEAALAAAEQKKIAIAVAIADAGGHLILLERMDGGRFHTVHSATVKAVCAASNRRPTGPRGAQAQALDTVHALGQAGNRFLLFAISGKEKRFCKEVWLSCREQLRGNSRG